MLTINHAMNNSAVLDADKWQWREFAETQLKQTTAVHSCFKHINVCLSDRTYLAGTSYSSVDRDIFRLIHPLMLRLAATERETFPHLCRWFRLIQANEPASQSSNAPHLPAIKFAH